MILAGSHSRRSMTSMPPSLRKLSHACYQNVKVAGNSFMPANNDHALLSHRLDNKTQRSDFSWRHTWINDQQNYDKRTFKTRYFKGRMYAIIPKQISHAEASQELALRQEGETRGVLFEMAFLSASSFGISSFVMFAFALWQRLA